MLETAVAFARKQREEYIALVRQRVAKHRRSLLDDAFKVGDERRRWHDRVESIEHNGVRHAMHLPLESLGRANQHRRVECVVEVGCSQRDGCGIGRLRRRCGCL